jgi:hypothetical protein
MATVQVEIPAHLRALAAATNPITLEVATPVTQRAILDALEARYPMLLGTIRDHQSKLRRPFLRFFACEQDLSHLPPDAELPATIASGQQTFLIIGAIAGG